jgi:hypothetical protein
VKGSAQAGVAEARAMVGAARRRRGLQPEHFKLCSRDPDGTALEIVYRTRGIPVIGESLMLPDDDENQARPSSWQETTVEVVQRYPNGTIEVWVGGFTGWGPGSVSRLFDLAERYMAAQR